MSLQLLSHQSPTAMKRAGSTSKGKKKRGRDNVVVTLSQTKKKMWVSHFTGMGIGNYGLQ